MVILTDSKRTQAVKTAVELLGEANRQEQKGEWDEAIQNNPKFH
ncbi:hypothetical protein PL8927_760040 [Planktothrix serta PCC 8927]|uniref:Uncharacterized protein n=1 Tax=Planktothrix serta PCC 8927 TaxID=671068 RepID=A0A7Z9BWK0_9CYAN|nr:hypothetical protein [Planktothrix serta]VXD22730.1 hypothetical protein PL8927_760040 [Planktothrix serta PCC 8927]